MLNALKKRVKNEKGLTLIELLAVVVILGIIAAIAIPAIGGLIDNSKKDAHIANATQMINSAKTYVAGNANSVNDGDVLTLKTMIDEGYIDQMEDPDGDAGYDQDTSKVVIGKADNTYTYKVFLDGEERDVGTDAAPKELNELDRSIFD